MLDACVDGLRDGVFKPAPERFEAMHAEMQHLQRLVDDLRTLSLGRLVSNTLRCTPSGGQITLSARRGGSIIALAVGDTGAGIAPEALLPSSTASIAAIPLAASRTPSPGWGAVDRFSRDCRA